MQSVIVLYYMYFKWTCKRNQIIVFVWGRSEYSQLDINVIIFIVQQDTNCWCCFIFYQTTKAFTKFICF